MTELKKIFQKKSDEKFIVIFTGDTSFGENYQQHIKDQGGQCVLEKFGYEYGLEHFKPIMKKADFVVINLETPITDSKSSPFQGQKDYIHWTHTSKAPKTLVEHNVSLITLANNHTFDYGQEGYDQTLTILKEHKLPFIGAGKNINEAGKPFICEIMFENKKVTIAIIAAFQKRPSYFKQYKVYADDQKPGLMPLDIDAIKLQVNNIKTIDPNAIIILQPHWGENYEWLNEEQINIADELFKIGVDLIIGHGSHMMQEFEKRKNKPVLYSLGNFLFNSPGRYAKLKASPYSSICAMEIQMIGNKPTVDLKLYPILSDNKITNYQPRFVIKSELNQLRKLLLQRDAMKDCDYLFDAQHDEFGYYFEVDVNTDDLTNKVVSSNNYIGMLYHESHTQKIKELKFNIILHRASVLTPELKKHGYQMVYYSPLYVDKESQTIKGFVFEDNKFQEIQVPIPKINYDFYIGIDDLNIYRAFQNLALTLKYKIYPTRFIRNLAQDKLLAAQILSEFDKSIIPCTESYDGSYEQAQKFLKKSSIVFIKARYGGRGNKIFVLKFENNQFILEYYMGIKQDMTEFATLKDCLLYLNERTIDEYIIQEAVDVINYGDSVFDIRALVFNEGDQWHFTSEVRIGLKSSKISNNGGTDIPIEFLRKLFSKEQAYNIMTKIETTTVGITKFLSMKHKELINELAFDVIIDKSGNIYLAEINTKPGLSGLTKYDDFFNMNNIEKKFYKELSMKHGEYLARSLVYLDSHT